MSFKRFKEELNIKKFFSYNDVLNISSLVTGNNLYRAKSLGTKGAYIYKTKEASDFQQEIEYYIKSIDQNLKDQIFCCKIILLYSSEWFFKNGNLKKIDLTNITKIVEDAICKGLGIDDSLFFRTELEKVIPIDTEKENYSKKLDIILNIDFYKRM